MPRSARPVAAPTTWKQYASLTGVTIAAAFAVLFFFVVEPAIPVVAPIASAAPTALLSIPSSVKGWFTSWRAPAPSAPATDTSTRLELPALMEEYTAVLISLRSHREDSIERRAFLERRLALSTQIRKLVGQLTPEEQRALPSTFERFTINAP